ncbi:cytosolic carboxypeptidase 2 isoform X2 [Betta splendens]|uniref:Cytosolic carboxypeptidase 2 n=1 Tax=Betta splendens TaxID=158456 RepID=A0A9W2XVH3_BETSP|nr:cytosolic carboxypeptidase 2 isoform X2 [Betta splendens]
MPVRDATYNTSNVAKSPSLAVSAIRYWRDSHHLDKLAIGDSKTKEDGVETAERRQLSINLNQTLRTRQLLIGFDGDKPMLSLRAPQDLVNFPSISCARWPTECEVIDDIIHHIEWEPSDPEPFYQPTGYEKTPVPVGEDRGKVVYCIDHATKRPFFTCSRVGGSRGPLKSAIYDMNQTDSTLTFESRFESGNLQKAVQVGVYDYELTLRTDLYTTKHTQWFYFRVRNMKAGVTYRFTITNLMKSSSLYSQGMRPLVYSERAAREKDVGWYRTGSNIKHYRNCNESAKDNDDTVPLFALTWTLEFPYDSDTCYLAHCYPYTYSHLQQYLMRISSNPVVSSYCKVRVLCHSLAGNAVYMVTITSQRAGRVDGCTKKAVVVTARVHPGETNGSWMMEGFLDFLLGDSEDAQLLRDTFIFKVVPMLNPDGVVVGNYRCSLAGRDLNRNYKTLLRDSFPCVWHTRSMVERLMAETDVILYCDFHGHSRKNNVFMYGCNNRGDASLKLQERIFPLMMSKNTSNKFSFKSCKFRTQRSKEGTGRIAMWRLGISNSYTMEATFGGSTLGDRKGTHFTTRDLKSLGFYFCDTLLDYCDPDQTKITYCLTELAVLITKEVRDRLGKTDCNFSVSDLETSTSGSNSSDSDGLPVHLLNQSATSQSKQTPLKKKKKRLRSRKERNRLRPDRVKNNTHQKDVQITLNNIESGLACENSVKESLPEKPVGRHRKKWQVNGLIKKAVPPSTAHAGEVSQVTLWQGCEPVKNDCLDTTMTPYLHHRAKACSHLTSLSRTVDGVDVGHWSGPSQMLHLSAIHPSSPNVKYYAQQQHHCPRPYYMFNKGYRGLPPSLSLPQWSPSFELTGMVPDIVPTKRLVSAFTEQDIFTDKSFQVSKCCSVPENSSTLITNKPMTSPQNEEQENSFEVGLSMFRCLPLGENQRCVTHDSLLRESVSCSSLFDNVLRSTDLRGQRLYKESHKDRRLKGVLPSLTKPSGLTEMELRCSQSDTIRRLQAKHTKLCLPGGESQSMVPQQAQAVRPSQSAPL